MTSKYLIACLAAAFFSANMTAQNADNSVDINYNKAFAEYQNGQFELCEQHTLGFLSDADGMLKKSSYRLLALCRLERGDIDGARKYVAALLKYDPYFTPSLGDPRRFVDLIEEKKGEENGITTASRRQESIDETPVAVTLITNDMIRRSGAQTLQELLCLYVPGMTTTEGLESNIAMHGIYGLTQEKILFLQDGHRMNSYSTNAEAPDYRSSLDKIDHIEVLRGPASSLYGNIALTAVVNIITRRGASINGGNIAGTIGTQGSYGGSFLAGGGNNMVDVTAWGSIYKTDGFSHEVTNANNTTISLYSNAYNNRPAYDMGIRAHWGDFTFSAMSQRSKHTPFVNVLQISPRQHIVNRETEDHDLEFRVMPAEGTFDAVSNFDYSRYASLDGDKPGASRRADNFTLDYSHTFGRVDFHASAFAALEKASLYNVIGDSLSPSIAALMSMTMTMEKVFTDWTNGAFFKMNWETFTVGGHVNASVDYTGMGKGSLLVGLQFEHFSASTGTLSLGNDYGRKNLYSSDFIETDRPENTYSIYAQLKHYFTPQLILNAGLRCDHKVRFTDNTITHLSPRLSLIYKFAGAYSARLSFNHSFVDAPYLYRASNIPLFTGGDNLSAEKMTGLQGGVMMHRPGSRITAEISCFYNSLTDLVQLNYAVKNSDVFVNAMKLKQAGIDAAVQYNTPRLFLTANATWQQVTDNVLEAGYKGSYIYNNETFSTPAIVGKIAASYCPYHGTGKDFLHGGALWLNATATAQSRTYYKDTDIMSTICDARNEVCRIEAVSPRCNIGLGLTYEWRHLDIDIRVKNITDNRYRTGSMLTFGTPHQGRQFIAKARVKF